MNTKIYDSPKETAEAFGDYLMMRAKESKSFHVALSGGSTPKLLFSYLAKKYRDSDVWGNVHFYWGDERCVAPSDDDSNFKMTNDLLLSQIDIAEEKVHRVHGEADPSKEVDRYANEIMDHVPTMKGLPVFDMIILGMGEDGHTASIFPHEMELMSSERLCEVATHPTSGQMRVTLTGHVINSAKEVAFLVTGKGKREKLQEIFNKKGDWYSYPASHISPSDGTLTWYMDKAATTAVVKA